MTPELRRPAGPRRNVDGMTFGLLVGLCVFGVGSSIVLDLRGFGTRAIRLSLYAGASPWNRSPEPSPERVDRDRVIFGCGVALIGLVIAGVSVLALA